LTALAFGLAPVLRVRRLAAHGALGMHGAAAAAPEQRRTLGALMIAQIALSTVLFVGAGLFARTLYNLRSADTGFARPRLVLARFDPAQAGYSGAQVLPLYDALVARIAALPGVERVTASNRGLFGDIETGSPVIVPGRPVRPDDNYYVSWNLVGDDFFATTGMTLIAGRAPRSQDTATAAHVVAVNDAFARTYFGTSNAVGRAFRMRAEWRPPVENCRRRPHPKAGDDARVGPADDLRALPAGSGAPRGIDLRPDPHRGADGGPRRLDPPRGDGGRAGCTAGQRADG